MTIRSILMLKRILIVLIIFSFISTSNAENKNFAVLLITNKMTSKTVTTNIPLQKEIYFDNINIFVSKCLTDSSELKFAGFLKIKNTKNNVVLFKGWIFSYSPSISEFYDQQFAIKLIKCKNLTNQDP